MTLAVARQSWRSACFPCRLQTRNKSAAKASVRQSRGGRPGPPAWPFAKRPRTSRNTMCRGGIGRNTPPDPCPGRDCQCAINLHNALRQTPVVRVFFSIFKRQGRYQAPARLVVSYDGQQAAVQDDDLFAERPPTTSSGSTSITKSGIVSTSSRMRASNLAVPTMPTLGPKLRKVLVDRSRWQWLSATIACDELPTVRRTVSRLDTSAGRGVPLPGILILE